jgi:hypothetical protein
MGAVSEPKFLNSTPILVASAQTHAKLGCPGMMSSEVYANLG